MTWAATHLPFELATSHPSPPIWPDINSPDEVACHSFSTLSDLPFIALFHRDVLWFYLYPDLFNPPFILQTIWPAIHPLVDITYYTSLSWSDLLYTITNGLTCTWQVEILKVIREVSILPAHVCNMSVGVLFLYFLSSSFFTSRYATNFLPTDPPTCSRTDEKLHS
jgi:hypothetical protein